MRALFAFLLFAGFSQPTLPAGNPHLEVDLQQSAVSYSYTEDGVANSGQFARFAADFHFDPSGIEDTEASLVFEMACVDLDDTLREGVLAAVPWFDSGTFPAARFRLTFLTPSSGGAYDSIVMLTVKNMELAVNFKLAAVSTLIGWNSACVMRFWSQSCLSPIPYPFASISPPG